MADDANGGRQARQDRNTRLSYKFQRLREQLRRAILNGEFHSRLPGERDLGRRFGANAKTVNKALSDLSAEGLLIRRIGRGTFLADRPGDVAGERRRSFLCLAPNTGTTPHRSAVLTGVRRRLTAQGHTFREITSAAGPGRGLPANVWPPETRGTTDGLVSYPYEPLSVGAGRLDEACIAEAVRRHVPIVVVGGWAPSAKLDAVVPDYCDAGFRLTEFLLQSDCSPVYVLCGRDAGREADTVYCGCQTAAARRRRPIARVPCGADVGSVPPVLAEWAARFGVNRPVEDAPNVGVVCVGRPALQAVRADAALSDLYARGRMLVGAVLEPGDDAACAAGVTYYEVDPDLMAGWAVRLLLDWRSGNRPTEIIVPGTLRVHRPTPTMSDETPGPCDAPDARAPAVHDEVYARATA